MRPQLYIPTHEYPPCRGGIAFYVEETARAAARLGWEVDVYAPGAGETVFEAEEPPGLRVLRLPMSGNQNWPDRWRMRTALREVGTTIANATLLLAEPGPLRLWGYASWLGLPRPQNLVVVLHGSEYVRMRRVPHRRWLLNRVLRAAGKIGVVSDYVADQVRRGNPECGDRLCRVPGALRSNFVEGLANHARVPEKRTFAGLFHILSVGRLHPRKGQLVSALALAELPQPLKARVRWRIAGPTVDATYEREVLAVANQAGIQVERLKDVSDSQLLQLYLSSDLLLFTPVTLAHSVEGLGLVSLEAAACGLPILACASGGVAEGLAEGENALLVASVDPAAVAQTLQQMLNQPELLARFACAGPAVAARYSWERNVHALLG